MLQLNYGGDGRPNGQADVVFGSAQKAKMAMTKHKQNMQSRYVELFYVPSSSQAGPARGEGGPSSQVMAPGADASPPFSFYLVEY